jgi:hypothetical protein
LKNNRPKRLSCLSAFQVPFGLVKELVTFSFIPHWYSSARWAAVKMLDDKGTVMIAPDTPWELGGF